MPFLVIECFPDPQSAAIVVDPETGVNKVLPTIQAAQVECEECQDGRIVPV